MTSNYESLNGLIHLSNHFPKFAPLTIVTLGTKPSTYESLGDISYPNHNTVLDLMPAKIEAHILKILKGK